MKVNRCGRAATLTVEQENAVLRAMDGRHAIRDRALFLLCLYTGMRRNEARLLNLGDVLDDEGGLRSQFSLRPEITKTKEARDIVLLQKPPGEALNLYLAERFDFSPNSPLFISQLNQRVALSTFSRVFEIAFKKAKVRGAATHSMRRTFVTRLAALGVPVKTISVMVGHSNLSTTSLYIDVTQAQIDEAMQRLQR